VGHAGFQRSRGAKSLFAGQDGQAVGLGGVEHQARSQKQQSGGEDPMQRFHSLLRLPQGACRHNASMVNRYGTIFWHIALDWDRCGDRIFCKARWASSSESPLAVAGDDRSVDIRPCGGRSPGDAIDAKSSMLPTLIAAVGLALVVLVLLLHTARNVARNRRTRKTAELIRLRLQDEPSAQRIAYREVEIHLRGN